jgi:hypothetical protein
MATTPTSSTPSPVGRRKAATLAPAVGLALAVALVLGGCTSTSDDLTARAESGARKRMASDHVAAVSCIQWGLYDRFEVDDADLPASIEACFDTSTVGVSDSNLDPGGYFLPDGTSLRSVGRDPGDSDTRHILAADVGTSSLSKDFVTVNVAYGQCWSSTIDLGARTMTSPEREQCSADLLWVIPGRGHQLDKLLTVAPDDVTGG